MGWRMSAMGPSEDLGGLGLARVAKWRGSWRGEFSGEGGWGGGRGDRGVSAGRA